MLLLLLLPVGVWRGDNFLILHLQITSTNNILTDVCQVNSEARVKENPFADVNPLKSHSVSSLRTRLLQAALAWPSPFDSTSGQQRPVIEMIVHHMQ